MHLIYLDESGNTGRTKDPNQPIHMIAALCVHEAQIRPIEEAVRSIVKARFGVLPLSPGFEMHGADLFSGNGFFKGVDPAARVACVHDVLDTLAAHDTKVIWAAVDKMRLYGGRHPHHVAFQFVVERVQDWLSATEGNLGLLVADENKEIEQKLIDELESYKKGGTDWGYRPTAIGSIVDSIHFVQSKNNKLIQCVDLVAYFSLKYMRQSHDFYEAFRVLSPRPHSYLAWRDAELAASLKKASIHEIGVKLDALTINSKLWPTS